MKESDERGPAADQYWQRCGADGEFSAAMARLENTVQRIVSMAVGQLSERATTLLNDTSSRLEAELRLHRVADGPEVGRAQARRRRRDRYRHRLVDRADRVNPKSGRLYKDPINAKIGGVCAGAARYFGVEIWTVRLCGLTGLLFLPGIVFPAYWIAYFIMDTPSDADRNDAQASHPHRSQWRNRREGSHNRTPGVAAVDDEPLQVVVAGRRLRYARADLTQAELRLRRLESFVTSDQYELHKEIAKLERDGEIKNGGWAQET